MSYSIIFETKIINLKDGRLLHLDLSGCNNDTSGRDRGDFVGKIHTKEEFVKYAESFKKNSEPAKDDNGFDLKIGSRYVNYFDYGEHLLRMLKRAKTWKELDCIGRYVNVQRIDGAKVFDNEKTITMSIKEFDDYRLKNMWNGIRYSILRTSLNTEEEIIKALDNNETVSFYIGKLSKQKIA